MSCNCDGHKNHTPDKALKHLFDNKIDVHTEIGAGFFLLPDPEKGPMRFKTVVVYDLSYVDVKVRGIDCLGFKWYPYSWKDKSTIMSFPAFTCTPIACSDDKTCESMGAECWCFRNECVG